MFFHLKKTNAYSTTTPVDSSIWCTLFMVRCYAYVHMQLVAFTGWAKSFFGSFILFNSSLYLRYQAKEAWSILVQPCMCLFELELRHSETWQNVVRASILRMASFYEFLRLQKSNTFQSEALFQGNFKNNHWLWNHKRWIGVIVRLI